VSSEVAIGQASELRAHRSESSQKWWVASGFSCWQASTEVASKK